MQRYPGRDEQDGGGNRAGDDRVDGGDNGAPPDEDRVQAFASMGFPREQVRAALTTLGNADDSVVLDYIAALQYASTPPDESTPVAAARPEDHDRHDEAAAAAAAANTNNNINNNNSDNINNENADALRLMGFPDDVIAEAMESCGEAQLETLTTFIVEHSSGVEDPFLLLVNLGYDADSALRATNTCKTDDIDVLVDFIAAESYAEAYTQTRERTTSKTRKRPREQPQQIVSQGGMKGFCLPGEPPIPRTLTREQARMPYFYFENVRSMPAGSWEMISSQLYDIQPEFVCARHFSVSYRARGYIHNLPLENRQALLPIPPKTLQEFLPDTVRFMPAFDTRTQLNCINTCGSTASFCRQVEAIMNQSNERPSEAEQRAIMALVKKWNLVWTGPRTCAPLESHEIERALGYDVNHTRGAIASNSRFKSLGNTFQVDVVGFHLSPLRPLFPDGIRVLSLFSGIGGAEVALHRAGIKLKFVVSVEASEDNRRILDRWWMTSRQTGVHHILNDVQEVTESVLKKFIGESGGFDLVIGGSPCNNFTGMNRVSRTGLEGSESALFFEFPRILNLLRALTP